MARRIVWAAFLLLTLLVGAAVWSLRPDAREKTIVTAARTCLGDRYDANRYPGGPPPRGRSACTDVIYWGYKPFVDLQRAVVVFFDDGDGVAGHVGIVSERWSLDGLPMLIHNPGPLGVEEDALRSNRLLGHFRLRP